MPIISNWSNKWVVSYVDRALLSWLSVALFIFLMGVTSMSQAQSSLDDLQKRKAIAEAEKAAIEAELARDDAIKKLANSKLAVDPAKKAKEDKLDAAKTAKEVADAEKAQAEAELAAIKAKIGEVPSSGISGSVKVEQGAASLETALLAARATNIAGEKIAKAVTAAVSASESAATTSVPKRLLVFAAGEVPDFQATTGFLAQRAIVLQALVDAQAQSEDVKNKKVGAESVAAVGVALEAVTKLLGFFKSDFEVRGSDVVADHTLLAKAVVGALIKEDGGFKPTLYLKATFNPDAVSAVGTLFKKDLESLNFQRDKATSALNKREREVSELQTELSKITGDTPADNQKKRQLGEQQKRVQSVVDKLKSAIAAYDTFNTFVAKLASPDANVAAMIREYEIWSALNDPSSLMLIVKMDKAGGSNYVEKSLWTSFGSMPFKVMGGVIVSYTLFQGNSGVVLASGVIPVHGGFQKVNNVGELF